MIVLDIGPDTDVVALKAAHMGLPCYHANPLCSTFALYGDAQPYPGSAKVEQNAVILVPVSEPYTKLSVIMDLLLGPFGCPWDREQSHETLKKYLLEEAYETLDAVDRTDFDALAEELGDLTLQPVFHARLAERDGEFPFDAPLRHICDKLLRRHPHVFGEVVVEDANEVLRNWDAIKKKEKSEDRSILEGVPKSMPALARAHEISKRAVRAGFEWPDFGGVLDKVREEIGELEEAIQEGDSAHIKAELGDLMFTLVNVARWQKVDAEDTLRMMLDRFQSRFQYMEAHARKPLHELSFEEWDDLWNQAKGQSHNS
ncbi:MAG: nucleoside triphosphate pyrophosphohydrolase [Armatimonadetes bacterium]|nr:nucleoside triphosphate pyrophosphohydrolase [Armatimonadota bacterium]